jgi:vacuolar-type H+-ATPase subunit I/STV1
MKSKKVNDSIEMERAQAAQILLNQLNKMQNTDGRNFVTEMERGRNMSLIVSEIMKGHKIARDHEIALEKIKSSVYDSALVDNNSKSTKTGYVAGYKVLSIEEKQKNIDASYE